MSRLIALLALWTFALVPARASVPCEHSILKARPLMETLATDGAFRTLATDALVRSGDGLFSLLP